MTNKQPEKSVEEIVNQIISSEPVQHLLAIEYRELATGREKDYDGETLKDAITTIITQTLQAERQKREEVVEASQMVNLWHKDGIEMHSKYKIYKNGELAKTDGKWENLVIAKSTTHPTYER